MVTVPVEMKVRAPPLVIVATPGVEDVNVGVRPDVAVAVNVGEVPKFWSPGLANEIVWSPFGVTEFEAAEAEPVPTPLVAVTVKVYEVPLLSPVTVMGEVDPVPVKPPGLDVTV